MIVAQLPPEHETGNDERPGSERQSVAQDDMTDAARPVDGEA